MKSSVNKLPKSQIEIEIEVSPEEFENFFEKAALEAGKGLEIKGFRKGKAPRNVFEKEIGEEKILTEAAKLAIEDSYQKALLENEIRSISRPEIVIKKLARNNPLVFKAKVSVLPEIKLPEYQKIIKEIKRKRVVVEDREIEEALKWLQKSRAKFTLKNEGAEKKDFISVEYRVESPESLKSLGVKKDAFVLGEGRLVPGFEENLIGMKAGQEKRFFLDIPEEHQLRQYGRKINFKAKMESVQNMELPAIDDQFAKSLGKFEDLRALKENIRGGLVSEKEQAESQRLREEILEKISQKTECDLPDTLVRREQEQMLNNLKKNVAEKLKISWEEYLRESHLHKDLKNKREPEEEKSSGGLEKSEEKILDSFLPQAQRNIKKLLILRKIGEEEKIEVSENEISREIERILKPYGNSEEARRNLGVDPQELRDYTKEIVRNEKIFTRLEELVKK